MDPAFIELRVGIQRYIPPEPNRSAPRCENDTDVKSYIKSKNYFWLGAARHLGWCDEEGGV